MDNERKTPQGTVAIMIIYFLFMLALWGNAYLTVLSRGVTR